MAPKISGRWCTYIPSSYYSNTNPGTAVKGFCRYNWDSKQLIKLKIGRLSGWVRPNHMSPLNMCLEIRDKSDRFEMFEGFNSRSSPLVVWDGGGCGARTWEWSLVSETALWLIASKKTRISLLQSQETIFWKWTLSSDENEARTTPWF